MAKQFRRKGWWSWALVGFCVAKLLGGEAEGAWFRALPLLPGTKGSADVFGISADGAIVVGYSDDRSTAQAVRWTADGTKVESLSAGVNSFARGASRDGAVIAGFRNVSGPGYQDALRWTAATGAVNIGDLPGGETGGQAFGVSDDGTTVVGASFSGNGSEAFRWSEQGGMTPLGDLPGGEFVSVAYATSEDGSAVVGYSSSSQGTQAFCWTAETGMVGLEDSPVGGFFSEAHDVSADGSVVVGRVAAVEGFFPYRAFRWTAEEGTVTLPDVLGVGSTAVALGVSADGNVIVGGAYDRDSASAFVWDPYFGSRSVAALLTEQGVDLEGYRLGIASSLSADGLTIAGIGITADRTAFRPWVARLDPGTFVPEPGGILLGLLFAGGLVGFLVFARWWGGGGSPLQGWDF